MSVLADKRKKLSELPIDEMYVIFGEPGSGKTVLASTFPKSTDEKMLFIDVLEGGTGSIPREFEDMIDVVQCENFVEFDEVFTDLYNGYTTITKVDEEGNEVQKKAKVPNYRTIVIDTITGVEYVLKEKLKIDDNRDSMTLQLWGKSKDSQEGMYNLMKKLHQKTGAIVVSLAHVMKIEDENNSAYNILLPQLQRSTSRYLCAKASYVWYTKVVTENIVDPTTHEVNQVDRFITTIEADPFLATKCRKPPKWTGVIPKTVKNLTYDKFHKHVLAKIKE